MTYRQFQAQPRGGEGVDDRAVPDQVWQSGFVANDGGPNPCSGRWRPFGVGYQRGMLGKAVEQFRITAVADADLDRRTRDLIVPYGVDEGAIPIRSDGRCWHREHVGSPIDLQRYFGIHAGVQPLARVWEIDFGAHVARPGIETEGKPRDRAGDRCAIEAEWPDGSGVSRTNKCDLVLRNVAEHPDRIDSLDLEQRRRAARRRRLDQVAAVHLSLGHNAIERGHDL
jgi:hypothetical protein